MLLAACVRRPLDAETWAQLDRCARGVLDWDLFLRWCQRHRVVSLACDALRQARSVGVPSTVTDRLWAASQQQVRASLSQIAETIDLIGTLRDAGIDALCLKGRVLSQLAFGSPALRDSRDVDLLVAPANFNTACQVLEGKGFRRIKPDAALPNFLLATYQNLSHELVYRSPKGAVIEIKQRLHPTPSLLPFDVEDLLRRPRIVDVAGHQLPTLPDLELFLYLCTHGSRHGWFRLKWIADMAALVSSSSVQFLTGASEQAIKLGISRPFREAILLSHDLLSAPVPADVLAQAQRDAQAERGASLARRNLAELGHNGDPARELAFTLRLDFAEYRLRPDWRYRGAVLRRHVAMHLYGAARWLVRLIRHIIRSKRSL